MNMHAKRPTAHAVALMALFVLATGGCMTRHVDVGADPVLTYPKTTPLNLRAALLLDKNFRDGTVAEIHSNGSDFYYCAANAMAPSAEAMARAMYRDVVVADGSISPAPPCDVVIRPHMTGWENSYVFAGGYFLFMEWTVATPNGQILWKQTVRGGGDGQGYNEAITDLFLRSFEQMSASPEIRQLAGKSSGGG